MSKKLKKTIILGDQHIPYLDEYTEELVRKVGAGVGATDAIIAGDLVDFVQFSNFAKNPMIRLTGIPDDCRTAHKYLKAWSKIINGGPLIYMAGNHENRLNLWKAYHPEIATFDGLTMDAILDLKGAGVTKYISYSAGAWTSDESATPTVHWLGGDKLAVIHGVRYSVNSGAICNLYARDYGCSGMSFHNHKNAKVSRRFLREDIEWFEVGCMCQLHPEYKPNPNWQQGFAIVTQESPSAPLDVQLITIYNNKSKPGQRYCFADGKKFIRG